MAVLIRDIAIDLGVSEKDAEAQLRAAGILLKTFKRDVTPGDNLSPLPESKRVYQTLIAVVEPIAFYQWKFDNKIKGLHPELNRHPDEVRPRETPVVIGG